MILESFPARPPFAPRSTNAFWVEVLDRDTTYSVIFMEVDGCLDDDLESTLRMSAGERLGDGFDESIGSLFYLEICSREGVSLY